MNIYTKKYEAIEAARDYYNSNLWVDYCILAIVRVVNKQETRGWCFMRLDAALHRSGFDIFDINAVLINGCEFKNTDERTDIYLKDFQGS